MKRIMIFFAALALCACSQTTPPETPAAPKPKARPTYYGRNIDNMARLITYDIYGQKIGDGLGLYIKPDIIVAPMSFVKGAFSAKINKMDSRTPYSVFGYVAYDIDNDLVALRVGKRIDTVNPIDTTALTDADTVYTLDNVKNKLLKTSLALDKGPIPDEIACGAAIFDIDGNARAIVGQNGSLIPSADIDKILKRCGDGHTNIYELRLKTNKKYPSSKSISGFRIVTTMGNITLKLFDETPEYRDNFIRLVSDNFYDSLLVHRVLSNYLIQMGAADSKHAKADDVVGWQGPGYTLPMHIVPHLFLKRGMVAASKLPEDRNKNNRSDGSQFFIVAGRKFSNADLDQIEKDYGKRFGAAQRQAYTTVGGAPYIDGEYTVFAQVTSGMDVVDRIAAVPLTGDRPTTDIRIRDVQIIWK